MACNFIFTNVKVARNTRKVGQAWHSMCVTTSGGFRVGGARDKTKKGDPMMMSSYLANRDNNF